jgi:hypothetical protein
MNWARIKDFILHGLPDRPKQTEAQELRWHEIEAGNPFGMRVLDVRPQTRQLVAGTSDLEVASRYGALRTSDGRDLIGAAIPDAVHIATSLRVPWSGTSLPSVVFKSSSMEEK